MVADCREVCDGYASIFGPHEVTGFVIHAVCENGRLKKQSGHVLFGVGTD